MNDSTDYKVGYGKPPEQTRFKKGTSGNPRGRPKKSSLEPGTTKIDRVFNEKIKIETKDGRVRHITGQEVMLRGLIKKGLAGSTSAIKKLLEIRRQLLRILVESQPELSDPSKEPSIGALIPQQLTMEQWLNAYTPQDLRDDFSRKQSQ
jgi:hypothetical protein